jgi:hypothetical protein
MQLREMPVNSAHSDRHIVFPIAVIMRLVHMFRACSLAVAHRQFFFEYGPFESIRSMECSLDGLRPMSLRKSEKLFHSTFIPFPPYRCQSLKDGLLHLCKILRHKAYSSLYDSPCNSLVAHPQLWDRLYLRFLLPTGRFSPHEHRHSQKVSPACCGLYPITVHSPNC